MLHFSCRSWAATLAAVLVVATPLAGCGDDEEGAPSDRAFQDVPTVTETTTTATTTTATTTTSPPAQTIEDARAAVDEDRYAEALAIAAVLSAREANSIRRRIANRYARRIRSALSTGDRARASFLLRQAGRYPRTQQLTQARSSYRAAKERVAERARQRRLAAEQRAAAREQRKAARQQRQQQQQQDAAPSAPSAPSGTCSEIPQTDFPVPPGDPRDRDGDGIACES